MRPESSIGIKPENILIGTNGYAKLADFGLAKLFERTDGQAVTQLVTAHTRPGVVMGTIGYMSPEQASGKPVDARSDIFSFGVILQELLVLDGRRPFAGSSDLEELQRIVHTAPTPLGDEVPLSVRTVVDKALEKNPAERYQSMRELVVDLRRLTRNGVLTNSAAAPARPRRWTKGRYWAMGAAAVVLTAGLTYPVLRTPSRTIDSIVVLPFTVDSGLGNEDYLAERISESLTTLLSRLHGLKLKSSDAAFAYRGQRVEPQVIGKQLGVRGVLRGRLALREGTLSVSAELVDTQDGYVRWRDEYNRPANDMLGLTGQISREIAENLRGTLSGDEARELTRRETGSAAAYQLYLRGRYSWNRRTESALKQSVDFFQRAVASDPAYALAWAGLADSYAMLAAYGVLPFEEAYPRAKAAATRALELDSHLAGPHASLARVKTEYEWDWVGAEQEYKRAIALNPNYATAHHWYAIHLAAVGRTQEATAEIARARDADPLSPVVNSQGGWIRYFARDYDAALRECQRAIDMDPRFAWGHSGLGSVYLQQGRFEEGIAELEQPARAAVRTFAVRRRYPCRFG